MRAAVCGLGIGMAHCAAYLDAPGVELVAVADALPERLERVGGTFAAGSMSELRGLFDPALLERRWDSLGVRVYRSLDELLRAGEFDLLSLCTPDALHAEQAVRVLRAGKHLLLEKPVALTPADAARVVAAAGASPECAVEIDYEFRINPAVRRVSELIAEGAVGEVSALAIHHFRTPFKRDKWGGWIQRRALSGGLLVEETSHWFDLLRYLSGREISDLGAVATDRVHPDFDFEDIAYVQGHLEGGAIFQVAHSLAGFDFSLVLTVSGPRGTIWCGLKSEERSILDLGQGDHIGVVAWGDPNRPASEARAERFGTEAREAETIRANVMRFAERLRTGASPLCTLEDGVRALEAALLANRAVEENQTVAGRERDDEQRS